MSEIKTHEKAKALLLSRPEAAARLAISLRTLDLETSLGNIPAVRIGRRNVRYRPAALDAYIEASESRVNPKRRTARK